MTQDHQITALMALARQCGDIERRHCIGKAQGFDVRNAYAELESAITSLLDKLSAAEARAEKAETLLLGFQRIDEKIANFSNPNATCFEFDKDPEMLAEARLTIAATEQARAEKAVALLREVDRCVVPRTEYERQVLANIDAFLQEQPK